MYSYSKIAYLRYTYVCLVYVFRVLYFFAIFWAIFGNFRLLSLRFPHSLRPLYPIIVPSIPFVPNKLTHYIYGIFPSTCIKDKTKKIITNYIGTVNSWWWWFTKYGHLFAWIYNTNYQTFFSRKVLNLSSFLWLVVAPSIFVLSVNILPALSSSRQIFQVSHLNSALAQASSPALVQLNQHVVKEAVAALV